jgi:hypothetical protein
LVSLNTNARMLARDTQPRVLAVRRRTLAKVDSMGLLVRKKWSRNLGLALK